MAETLRELEPQPRSCCGTAMGTKHEEWCERSTALLRGYEARVTSKERSQDAKTSEGNVAPIASRRNGRWEFPGVKF